MLLINIAITNLWLYEAEYTFLDIYNDSVFLSSSWIRSTGQQERKAFRLDELDENEVALV